MKILKLNCVVPSPEATASGELGSVLLYVAANQPTFFAISFAEFREQISHGINKPLSNSELTDFKTNYFNKENIAPLETSDGILLQEYLQREDDSRNNIISLLEITKNWRVPRFYSQARTNFFADSIAKIILEDEIKLDAHKQRDVGNANEYFALWDRRSLENVFQHYTNYTEEKINRVFFLIDSAARICHEFIKFNKLDPLSNIDIWRGSITQSVIKLLIKK